MKPHDDKFTRRLHNTSNTGQLANSAPLNLGLEDPHSEALILAVPPGDWDEERDWQYYTENASVYAEQERDKDCASSMLACISGSLKDFYGALNFAFAYLTGRPYEPNGGAFRLLPLATKVGMLRELLKAKRQEPDYLDRFEQDLNKFLQVEHVACPVLQRYASDPATVWLRELVDLDNALVTASFTFAESMACEHDDCPDFVSVDGVPPLRLLCS